MDELRPETTREIIKLLFPDLRYGGDPDVDRYFESRKAGRLGQALSIYNGALRVRYPDDASRVTLLKLYREGDPRYASYQERLLSDFAARISSRIRRNIDLITAPLEKADLSDALRALKAVESVLSRLPGEAEGAPALLARYHEFARVLGHRQALARKALEIVREYDAVSRADTPSDYDFVARSAAIEERRRSSAAAGGTRAAGREEGYDFVSRSAQLEAKRRDAERQAPSYFDPARIKFTEADKSRVEISKALTRREDKVLAFCAKYWPQAGDAAFERMVFLYSRKFGGRHFEIFRAVKAGRARGATDDEILNAVAAILTTSYNYSVSGDLYMQVMWRRLRARMEARIVAERLAAPGPESRVRARHAAYAAGTSPEEEILKAPASVPRPPAGDEAPTRFGRRAGEHAAPPVFALKEASARGRAGEAEGDAKPIGRAGEVARRKGTAIQPGSLPRKHAAQPAPDNDGLGLRAASRAAALPERRIPAPSAPASKAPVPKAPTREPPNKASKKTAKAASPAAGAAPNRSRPAAPAPNRGRAAAKAKSSGASASPILRPTSGARGALLLGRGPVGPEPMREIRSKHGSISDSIRKLSGRTYDVYKEIFLERVRDHIRKILLANQTRSHGLFDTAANDAEDQVYGFIAAHYDDPFMDWERSAEREAVESLGFSMPSLAPVIEACFRKL